MHGSGGFEGNGHTLRILSKLENFSEEHGSNLTCRAMLAVLKYPVPFSIAANHTIVPKLDEKSTSIKTLDRKSCKPPKCYFDDEIEVVDSILDPLTRNDKEVFRSVQDGGLKHHKAKYKSFDCSIMDLSDDIAYGVHDLEDAIALNLVTEKSFHDLINEAACAPFLDHLKHTYPKDCGNDVYDYFVLGLFKDSKQRKRFIGRLVHLFVTNVQIETIEELEEPLIRYRATIPSHIVIPWMRCKLSSKRKLSSLQMCSTWNLKARRWWSRSLRRCDRIQALSCRKMLSLFTRSRRATYVSFATMWRG